MLLRLTASPTALAIDGAGWFIVRVPETGEYLATRKGAFHVDANNFLVNATGCYVQGFRDPDLNEMGSLSFDWSMRPVGINLNAAVTNIAIESNGSIRMFLDDGTNYVRGQILLQQFLHPQRLIRTAPALYAGLDAAGPRPSLAAPGTQGLGWLRSHYVELEPLRLNVPRVNQPGMPAQGALTAGVVTDFAIVGNGFFQVRDPQGGGRFATRAGMFLLDGDGYLITYRGMRVQGYRDSALTELGDVQIDAQQRPVSLDHTATMMAYAVGYDGRVRVRLSDGSEYARGQILLWSFENPTSLVKTNDALYVGVAAARSRPLASARQQGLGTIRQGVLELLSVTENLLAERRDFSLFQQGTLLRTDVLSDLAISGTGFFAVRNPAESTMFVTRNAPFHFDDHGYLVTAEGYRVQGFADGTLTNRGDVHLDPSWRPTSVAPEATVVSCAFDDYGRLRVQVLGRLGSVSWPGAVAAPPRVLCLGPSR